MKDIQQLIKKNSQEGRYEDIFPKTFIDAVLDKESGVTLTDILAMFNMLFLSYNGSRSQTRLQVPSSLRREGLWVTYVLYDKTVVTEWYNAEAIDDTTFGDSANWRDGSNALVGDISISSDGYWVINGEVTNIKAQGEAGITPILRVGSNNHLQVSYTNGSSYVDVSSNPVFTQFRVSNNKLQQSTDLGESWSNISEELAYKFRESGNKIQMSKDLGNTWEDVSDYIAAWFRFTGTTGSSQADNVGKIQISRDNGATWSDLSGEFTNSLHIKGYVATVGTLPSTAVQGDIYGVGPTYDTSDTEHTNPIYQLYVKNSTGWVNNGRFTSIAAGVVQEFGNNENVIISQKAISDVMFKRGSIGITLGNRAAGTTKSSAPLNLIEIDFKSKKLIKNTGVFYIVDSSNKFNNLAREDDTPFETDFKVFDSSDGVYPEWVCYLMFNITENKLYVIGYRYLRAHPEEFPYDTWVNLGEFTYNEGHLVTNIQAPITYNGVRYVNGSKVIYNANLQYALGGYNFHNKESNFCGFNIDLINKKIIATSANIVIYGYDETPYIDTTYASHETDITSTNNFNFAYTYYLLYEKVEKKFYMMEYTLLNSFIESHKSYNVICIGQGALNDPANTWLTAGVYKVNNVLYGSKLVSSGGSNNKLAGKTMSILGDSISTFNGYLVSNKPNYTYADYSYWYPSGDITSVNDTWWSQVASKTGITILNNCAWSGSTCCGNSKETSTAFAGCSDRRINDLSFGGTTPDIILVYIGINDFGQNSTGIKPLGTWDGNTEIPVEGVIDNYSDALAVTLSKIITKYPKSRVFCCNLLETGYSGYDYVDDTKFPTINKNGDTLQKWNERIRIITESLGVPLIDIHSCGISYFNLDNYTIDRLHPNRAGAAILADRISNELLLKY